MGTELQVGLSDSFSQYANEGVEEWIVQQNSNMPEVENVAQVMGGVENQPAVNEGIDTTEMDTRIDDIVHVGYQVQVQPADSLFGIAEICNCIGNEINELRGVLNNQSVEITASIDGGQEMEVENNWASLTPELVPNSFA